MLKVKDSIIYSMTNTLATAQCGIEAGATKLVIFNLQHYYYGTNRNGSLFDPISAGTIVVKDYWGNIISEPRAVDSIQSISTDVNDFVTDYTTASQVSSTYNLAIRLHWNLSAQHAIMDLIGQDILSTDFTNLGVTRSATIARMEPAYALVMQGQFTEAVAVINAMTTDGYFTADRIAKYAGIVNSADAFNFVY